MSILERTNGLWYPTLVLLKRRMFVGVLALIWLAGVTRCPLEAAGMFANDYCCGGSSSAAAKSSLPVTSDCSYDQSARLLPRHGGDTLLLPNPIDGTEISPSIPAAANRGCSPVQIGVERSAIAQCWQFCFRAAMAPRAPSFPT